MFKIAIVGAGGIAGVHAGGYANIENAQIVGVYDTRPEAAQKLAEKHDTTPYDDFDRMLAEARPDVLDVCCPTPWHGDYVCRAAARAKEIGIVGIATEKPMARTLADCDRMIAACEAASVPLFVAHVLRWFPEYALAKRGVDAGYVGVPAAIRTRRGGPMPRAWNDWYANMEWSGGLVLDMIIHDFDWLRWTFGEVERVYAKGCGAAQLPAFDYALVTLRFRSGAIAHVEGTWADPGGFRATLEIAGDGGLAESNFNAQMNAPFRMALTESEGGRAGVPIPESPTQINPYQAEFAHFLDCLEAGTPPMVSPQDGREAVRIALADLESIQSGKPVAL